MVRETGVDMVRWLCSTVLIAGVVLIIGIAPASASCIGYRDPTAEFRKAVMSAPVVFVGDVVATSNIARTADVSVVEVWRGSRLPSQVVVHGSLVDEPNSYTSVDRYFTVGRRLLFVPGSDRSPFKDGACSFTREYTDEVAKLRPTGATAPAPSPVAEPAVEDAVPSSPSLVTVTLGAVAIALASVLAATFRSRALKGGANG
jgi:hypothetical protein